MEKPQEQGIVVFFVRRCDFSLPVPRRTPATQVDVAFVHPVHCGGRPLRSQATVSAIPRRSGTEHATSWNCHPNAPTAPVAIPQRWCGRKVFAAKVIACLQIRAADGIEVVSVPALCFTERIPFRQLAVHPSGKPAVGSLARNKPIAPIVAPSGPGKSTPKLSQHGSVVGKRNIRTGAI